MYDRTAEHTGLGASGTTVSVATEHAAAITTSTGVVAAVGDVRLTIRSSKSALSERPFGPSASIGIAWATERTQAENTRVKTASSLTRIALENTPELHRSRTL